MSFTLKNQISKDFQKDLNEHFKLSITQNDRLYILLLILGADVETGHGMAMREKAEKGDFRSVKLLYHYGADPNDGLAASVKRGDLKTAKFLLKKKAKPYGWYLNDAIKNGDIEMIQLLVDYNVEVTKRSAKEAEEKLGVKLVYKE